MILQGSWDGETIERRPDATDRRGSAAPLLFWAEHTAGVPFETGIQRVVRHMRRGLRETGVDVVDVGWDRAKRLMRFAEAARGASAWLLIPEVPVTVLAEDLDPVAIGRGYGLRTAAVVHDLIPLKLADDYCDEARRIFTRYYRMFAEADRVFATTHHVADDLRAHLATSGLRVPEIIVCPLPAQFADTPRAMTPLPPRGDGLALLCVSTWEPRKNLPCLLRALRRAADGLGEGRLRLTLVGRRADWAALNAEIEALARVLPGVRLLERTDDQGLRALYREHHAGIYPSREEGFGLPILESLWLGRPCVCHDASSMAEVAPGGGTWMIDTTDETAIAGAIRRLAEDEALLGHLHAEALARPLASWADYAQAIASHLRASADASVGSSRSRQ